MSQFFVLHSNIFPGIDSSDSESARDIKHQGQESSRSRCLSRPPAWAEFGQKPHKASSEITHETRVISTSSGLTSLSVTDALKSKRGSADRHSESGEPKQNAVNCSYLLLDLRENNRFQSSADTYITGLTFMYPEDFHSGWSREWFAFY